MKNNLKTIGSNFSNTILRSGALLITNIIMFSYSAAAQNDGPSLSNAKKNLTAISTEMSREEKLSYLGMVVGFIVVMAVAWFSTVAAKKRKLAREEMIRRHHLQHTAKHNMHDPYYKRHAHSHTVSHSSEASLKTA